MKFVIVLLSALLVSSTSAAKTPVPLLDVDGKAIQQGVQYHVVPADGSRGGGMGLMKRNTPCPVHVVEDLSPAAAAGGIPVNFTSANPNDTTVYMSADVNVGFSVPTVCGKSPVWRLGAFDRSTGKWYVTTGGTVGAPGRPAAASNWFKVERFGKGYKFVFCPHVCRYCKVVCGDVGAIGGDVQKRFLGVSSVPAAFVFRKTAQQES